jgi:hypothetical protein
MDRKRTGLMRHIAIPWYPTTSNGPVSEMMNLIGTTAKSELGDLTFGEQILLWASRYWVQALMQGTSAHETLQTGFKLAGAPAAHPALDGLMTVIATSAKVQIDIRCQKCSEVSFDEHRLMAAVAAWQRGASAEMADRILEVWMPAPALRAARGPAAHLAAALGNAGLIIRSRIWIRPSEVEFTMRFTSKNGSATIH